MVSDLSVPLNICLRFDSLLRYISVFDKHPICSFDAFWTGDNGLSERESNNLALTIYKPFHIFAVKIGVTTNF